MDFYDYIIYPRGIDRINFSHSHYRQLGHSDV